MAGGVLFGLAINNLVSLPLGMFGAPYDATDGYGTLLILAITVHIAASAPVLGGRRATAPPVLN